MTAFNAATAFDDLEDAAAWADAPSENIVPFGTRVGAEDLTAMPAGPQFKERCAKCGGSGRWGYRGDRQCFACQGAGFRVFRTSGQDRARGRAAAQTQAAKRRVDLGAAAEAWHAANPAESAWMRSRAPRFDFAASMVEAVARYGALTAGQMAAVQKLAARDAERDAERAAERIEREAAAPAVTVARLVEAFDTARSSGLKRLRLRLAGFVFSPAPDHGRNAGAIYVKAGDTYLGKIAEGRFQRVFACTAADEALVVEACADPEAAAVAYGMRTGSCSCCGKELTNAESIARGIGPICAGKWGW
jgi:hypothetical protein